MNGETNIRNHNTEILKKIPVEKRKKLVIFYDNLVKDFDKSVDGIRIVKCLL